MDIMKLLRGVRSSNDISTNKIPNLSADWGMDETNGLPYSGASVQEFLKTYCQKSVDNEQNKMGAFYFDTAAMKFYTFRTQEDRDSFISNGDSSLILSSQDIVFGGTQKKLTIINKMSSSNIYFTTNAKKAEITVGFESKEKEFNAPDWTDVIEDAYFTVSVDKGVTGTYVNILENVLVRHGETLTFDVFNYISSGPNRVKVTAVGLVSEQTANLGYSVTLTSMYLSPANFGWYLPFVEGSTYNLGGMNIGGALQKKLIIKVTNDSGYSEQYEENIGTAVYVTNPYYYTKLPFPSAGTGVYHVELWLDADGLQSEHLEYNIMCVATDDITTAQLCCIANVAEEAVNYSDNSLFDYAVYNGGSTTATPHINLTAMVSGEPVVIVDEDLQGVETGKQLTFNYNLEIETEENDVTLSASLTYGNEQTMEYPLNNSASFPSTAGAMLYINSAVRNNSQENKTDIINEATKETVTAEWTNMSWVDGTDGWTVDNEGRKCLFMPARTKATINYKPLQSVGNGKTIEFTFKVSNASDYDENIISVCDAPDNPLFRGIRIRPNNILIHSRDLNTDNENQSYDIPEDTLINVCVSVIRNYKTNYGNICIVYVNGVRKKEFAFTNADSWLTDANIIIGSETSDLYLYNVRVYDKGFGTQDALQNYVASLPNSIDKRKAYELIHGVIDDSFNVDFEKTKAVANVVTIEMLDGAELPHYGLSKEYTAQCNMELFWNKNPEWNWWIENMKVEGQGTTSMNYFRWNLRWRLDKADGFTVHLPDGSTSTDDTLWFDGEGNHPKLARMTAKINYASSMQSHKIGATAMFNDVHHHLGLDNEAGGRVAVFQHPFYFFEKKKIEGTEQYTYSFIGLFTFGADKGDKYTFGYKNPEVKDTLLVLEGLDHPIKGVGMDYPWSEMKYVADEESLCVDKGNNNYDAAWEVSQSGSAESEEEIQAKLDEEFKPAYEVAYNNSTMIIGTDETLETINSDVDAWGQRKDENGNAYQRYEFWIDGEYELYYLSKKTNKYVKNGINLLTQLGLSAEDLSGLDVKAKNELFKQKRREKFKAEMQNYWHLDDCLYCYCFLLLLGATDNFKKNSYPYKLGTLAGGSRWRWRQDDLDTLFDIDNQGLAVKGYSIEAHDWTDDSKTAYVFKGEDSVFWTLIGECFEVESKTMGKKILGAMYEMSSIGTTTIDRLIGFFQKYFWDNAQNYFTKSAYNSDAEYKYEEAWPKYASGEYDVDVHPLSQSLGDHLEAEMLWVRQRLIYMMSKWGYGPFAQYTDSCLGRINFRTQLAQSFKLTPFMDLYPCILSGQGATHASADRVLSGEEVTIAGAGGTNTNVYIMAADELESIGDLSTLTVDAASNAGIAIASKRLKTIKVGDEVAEKVTSNLQQLSVGLCNSLISVDARNLKSLTGTVDLTRCPRLVEALFGGTDVRSVQFASGSKIEKIQLSDATTVLELRNLGKLKTIEWGNVTNVEFFRIENCPSLDSFAKLKEIYNMDGNKLSNIRLIGFTYSGEIEDVDLLANLAEDRNKDGEPHDYRGITSDGVPSEELLPVIEGNMILEGNTYEDSYNTVRKYFPNVVFDIGGELYIRFADPEVLRILKDTSLGDGTGVILNKVREATSIPYWATGGSAVTEFNELEKFENLESLPGQMFRNSTTIASVKLPPNLKTISNYAFTECTNLIEIGELPKSLKTIGYAGLRNVRCLEEDIDLPNLTTIDSDGLAYTNIVRVLNIPKVTSGTVCSFSGCTKLVSVNWPVPITGVSGFSGCAELTTLGSLEEVTNIKAECFRSCGKLEVIRNLNLPNLTGVLGKGAFYESGVENVISLGTITEIQGAEGNSVGTFAMCENLRTVNLPETIENIGNYAFSSCTNLESINLPDSITTFGNYVFMLCPNLVIDLTGKLLNVTSIGNYAFNNGGVSGILNLPKLESLGFYSFSGSGITGIESLGNITSIPNNCFDNCTNLIFDVGNIPQGITDMGDSVFKNCPNVTGIINLPNLTGKLRSLVFYNTSITKAVNLGIITHLMDNIFNYSKINKIIIPETVIYIGNQMLRDVSNYVALIVKNPTPCTIGKDFFVAFKGSYKWYVPDESVEAYKQASVWSNWASNIHPLSEYVEGEEDTIE